MQKFVAIYKGERDGPFWGHCFVKDKRSAYLAAKEKVGKKATVSIVWVCEWRDLKAEPEHVHGANEGKGLVDNLLKEVRAGAGLFSAAPKKEEEKMALLLPDPKPRVRIKKKKETPTYSPPYTIHVQGDKK